MKTCRFLLIVLLLSGCASERHKPARESVSVKPSPAPAETPDKSVLVVKKLTAQLDEWKGVPYRFKGITKSGVDCSGFVMVTLKNKFRVEVPHSSVAQSNLGEPVKKSQLRSGDLVFFQKDNVVNHVGIYLEDGTFIHASTSRGVMRSRLTDIPWDKTFIKAIRLQEIYAL